jgi:phosphocarrier protein HPr
MSPSSERSVRLPADLHARPAGQVCRAAAGFRSRVVISCNGKDADARSVLLVMSLGATRGAEVSVRAEGEDAERAVEVISGMLASVPPVEEAGREAEGAPAGGAKAASQVGGEPSTRPPASRGATASSAP